MAMLATNAVTVCATWSTGGNCRSPTIGCAHLAPNKSAYATEGCPRSEVPNSVHPGYLTLLVRYPERRVKHVAGTGSRSRTMSMPEARALVAIDRSACCRRMGWPEDDHALQIMPRCGPRRPNQLQPGVLRQSRTTRLPPTRLTAPAALGQIRAPSRDRRT
jgi:hypothetical protein